MPNLEVRGYIGTSLIVCTLVNILLNLGMVVVTTFSLAARKLKLYYLEWKLAQ
jgi:hypothetical protein